MPINTLKKLSVSEITPETSEDILDTLNAAKNEIKSFGEDEIKTFLNFQDEDGAFRPFCGKWIYDSDIYYSLVNRTTCSCLVLLLQADLERVYENNHEPISKCFNYIMKHGLRGHGYNSFSDEASNYCYLLRNGLKQFLKKNKQRYREFISYLDSLINTFRKMKDEGSTIVGFDIDISDQINDIIQSYDYEYYIAYGSNLNVNQMQNRCPGAAAVFKSFLNGYKLEFHKYLTIKEDAEKKTPVVVWKINKEHEESLDRYEGVSNKIYRKEYILLNIDGKKIYGLVYIMNNLPDRQNVVPSKEYFKTCLDGYCNFCLERVYLLDALNEVKKAN